MKKLMIAVFGVLFFAPLAFADGWGVGVKVGVAESDPKDIKETYHAFGGELNEGYGVFSVEGLHEWNLGSEADKIGVKLGIDSYGETE